MTSANNIDMDPTDEQPNVELTYNCVDPGAMCVTIGVRVKHISGGKIKETKPQFRKIVIEQFFVIVLSHLIN